MRSRLELLTKQAEKLLGGPIREAEQHRFLAGLVRDAGPRRHDEDVLRSPLEDAVADVAPAMPFHDAEDRTVRRTLAAAAKTAWQKLHEGCDGRHRVTPCRGIGVLQLDAVARVDRTLTSQTLECLARGAVRIRQERSRLRAGRVLEGQEVLAVACERVI